jgi:hypothetical protein
MLFSLILIGLVIYNARQVSSLRHEVTDLKSQVAAMKSSHGGKSSGNPSLIGKALTHVDLARKCALKGDFKRASAELEKGVNLMQRAGRDASGPYVEQLDKAERTLTDAQKFVERLRGSSEKKGG